MATRLVLALLTGLAFATVTPAAFASSSDVATTRTYIRAGYAALRVAKADLPATGSALTGLEHQLIGQCPKIAVGSPQDHDSEQLSNELVGAMTATAYHTDAGVIATFARTVRGLHWSNPTLTREVKSSATKLRGLSTLAVPDVCSDIQAWVASGYQTLPASTVQFDQRYAAVDPEAEEVSLRLLRPYEDAAVAAQVRGIERFEAALAEFEAHAVGDYTRIMDALELNP
jgi:hypothetical protein